MTRTFCRRIDTSFSLPVQAPCSYFSEVLVISPFSFRFLLLKHIAWLRIFFPTLPYDFAQPIPSLFPPHAPMGLGPASLPCKDHPHPPNTRVLAWPLDLARVHVAFSAFSYTPHHTAASRSRPVCCLFFLSLRIHAVCFEWLELMPRSLL